MVVDIVLFNGEEDIFNLRYNILKDVVDEFVVVEFGKTFSGNDKSAHPINLPKVSYHYFTQVKDLKPNLPPAFAMEYNQREMLRSCLPHLHDDDIVFMGDVDEIWNPKIQGTVLNKKLKLQVYSYYLNNKSTEDFALGTVVMKWGDMKKYGMNDLRSNVELTNEYHGWHFTNMGGLDKLKYKIESYGHQEYNTSHVKDNLVTQMKENKDYIGRRIDFTTDESDWPPWLTIHREEYRHLLK